MPDMMVCPDAIREEKTTSLQPAKLSFDKKAFDSQMLKRRHQNSSALFFLYRWEKTRTQQLHKLPDTATYGHIFWLHHK